MILALFSLFLLVFNFIYLAELDSWQDWVAATILVLVSLAIMFSSFVFLRQFVYGSSIFLKLTEEGLSYYGYGLGRKSFDVKWTEVERIFHTKIERRVKYRTITTHFISFDFVDPDIIWKDTRFSGRWICCFSKLIKKDIEMVT
ncbi:hypothetical protein ABID29_001869 [Streptococcus rupicaprae]|uniref:PH domain-containing protein n=1 Tax=Streptococcus rupicaprae TaxID=759619 RepID=A0ABV2FJM5_9STRE